MKRTWPVLSVVLWTAIIAATLSIGAAMGGLVAATILVLIGVTFGVALTPGLARRERVAWVIGFLVIATVLALGDDSDLRPLSWAGVALAALAVAGVCVRLFLVGLTSPAPESATSTPRSSASGGGA